MWKGGRFGVDAGSSLFWREGSDDGNVLDGSIFAGHGYGRESVDSMIFLGVPEGSLQRPGPCRAPSTGMRALWPPDSHNCRDEFSGVVRGPGKGPTQRISRPHPSVTAVKFDSKKAQTGTGFVPSYHPANPPKFVVCWRQDRQCVIKCRWQTDTPGHDSPTPITLNQPHPTPYAYDHHEDIRHCSWRALAPSADD